MGQARKLLERALGAFESGDLTVFREIIAPDAVIRNPSTTMRGSDEFAQRVQEAFVRPFSDPRIEIVNVVESGNGLAAEIKTTVRHTGTMSMPTGDLPPTGNTIVIEEASMIKANYNRIISWRSYYDLMAVLSQLGLMDLRRGEN